MTAQSWVETTLPPGYAGRYVPLDFSDTPEHNGYGWSCLGGGRRGFVTDAERNRAAWRHWTAAVLRRRGDVRARSYAESGGIDWHHPDVDDDCEVPIAWCGRAAITFDRDGRFAVGDEGHWYRDEMRAFDDVDEAMARFAWLVGFDQGPAKMSANDKGLLWLTMTATGPGKDGET